MNSQYKKLVMTALILNTMQTWAGVMGSLDDAPGDYDGIYAGANLGLSNLVVKEQHVVNPESHQLGSLGAVGGGYVGYDYTIYDRFNIGIEGYGNANGLNVAINHDIAPNTTYSVSSRYNAGVRILPGYQFSPGIQGHVILGYANGQFRVKDSGNYGYINSSFHKSGFQSGLGWTTYVIQGILVRLDVMYTTYGSTTSTGTGLPSSGFPTQTYYNSFSTLEGDLSLVYKF